eukprot:3605074-Prymnesium_polylepis.1
MLASNFASTTEGRYDFAFLVDGRLRMVDARSGDIRLNQSLDDMIGVSSASEMCLSLDDTLVALVVESEDDDDMVYKIYLIDACVGDLLHEFSNDDNEILDIAFSNNGQMLAFGTNDGKLRLLTVQRDGDGVQLQPHSQDSEVESNDWVRCLGWSSNDELLVCGDDEGAVKVREASPA